MIANNAGKNLLLAKADAYTSATYKVCNYFVKIPFINKSILVLIKLTFVKTVVFSKAHIKWKKANEVMNNFFCYVPILY